MHITILTLFPQMFSGPFEHSIIKRAQEDGFITLTFLNIRDFGIGSHKTVDDTAYGGGKGMVMRVDVVYDAFQKARRTDSTSEKVFLLSAQGEVFTQKKAEELSQIDHLILICGHYEGIDSRILEFIDGEISIGDFVLTGGEIPAMLLIDSITRLLPGVLEKEATEHESFSLTDDTSLFLEYPQYTRPVEFQGQKVPDILLSGNHQQIASWRSDMAKKTTLMNRPDLLKE